MKKLEKNYKFSTRRNDQHILPKEISSQEKPVFAWIETIEGDSFNSNYDTMHPIQKWVW